MPPQIRRDNSPDYSDVPLWRSRDNSPESDEGNTRQRVEPPAGGSGYISDGATTFPYSSLASQWLQLHNPYYHDIVLIPYGSTATRAVFRRHIHHHVRERIAPPYVESETIATQFLASSSALDGVEEVD